MIKKILIAFCAIFMIFSLSVTSFAEEGGEYYDEYDNYDEIEEDFYQSVGIPEQPQKGKEPWYTELSVIPLLIGLVAGSVTTLILFRKQSIARHHAPKHIHPYALNVKHTVVSDKKDNTL